MPKKLYWLAPIFTLVISYFSLIDSVLPPVDLDNSDKLIHAAAYIVMTLLWYIFFYQRYLDTNSLFETVFIDIWSQWSSTIAIAAASIAMVIGILIELGQGFISRNRTMSFYDILANTAGIILAIALIRVVSLIFNKDKNHTAS